jgi:hypothetical protein
MTADLPTRLNLNRVDGPEKFLTSVLDELAKTVEQSFCFLAAVVRLIWGPVRKRTISYVRAE